MPLIKKIPSVGLVGQGNSDENSREEKTRFLLGMTTLVMGYAKQDWTDDNPRSFIRLQMIAKIKQLWLKDRVKEWQEPQWDRNAIRKRANKRANRCEEGRSRVRLASSGV